MPAGNRTGRPALPRCRIRRGGPLRPSHGCSLHIYPSGCCRASSAYWRSARLVTVHDTRREDPRQIIDELSVDISSDKIISCHVDRKNALLAAAEIALEGKRVVIVGKGHEEIERIGTKGVPFNETKILLAELGRLKGKESAI